MHSKDDEGNKILDITRLQPELQGQPISNEQRQQEKRERELVKKTLNCRYGELIQEKAAIGKNRIELENDQRIIPYYYFLVDCTPERLKELIKQLKPWGIQVFAYPRNDHLRKLDARAYVGYWVGPGSGPSMQRIYDFSVPGGKIRIIRQILITNQQYLAVDMAHRLAYHQTDSHKHADDKLIEAHKKAEDKLIESKKYADDVKRAELYLEGLEKEAPHLRAEVRLRGFDYDELRVFQFPKKKK